MKKILFILVLAVSSSAFADIKIMVGGVVDSQVGHVDQRNSYSITSSEPNTPYLALLIDGQFECFGGGNVCKKTHDTNFRNSTDVFIAVSEVMDNGIVYGGFAGFDNKAGRNMEFAPHSSRTYVWAENKYGHLELGSNYSVDAMMKVDATKIARATGGIDGDWYLHANTISAMRTNLQGDKNTDSLTAAGLGVGTVAPLTTISIASETADGFNYFVISPNFLTTAANATNIEDSRKISYISPRVDGVQVGVSLGIDQGSKGNSQTIGVKAEGTKNSPATATYTDLQFIWTFGLNYRAMLIDDYEFNGSLLANVGSHEYKKKFYEALREYQVGAAITKNNITVATSYQNSGKSMYSKNLKMQKNGFYTFGIAHVDGPVGTSLTFMRSKAHKNRFRNVVVGTDYQFARGIYAYGEAAFFKFSPAAGLFNASNNQGHVLIAGTKVIF